VAGVQRLPFNLSKPPEERPHVPMESIRTYVGPDGKETRWKIKVLRKEEEEGGNGSSTEE